jgi:hypothetical protein
MLLEALWKKGEQVAQGLGHALNGPMTAGRLRAGYNYASAESVPFQQHLREFNEL